MVEGEGLSCLSQVVDQGSLELGWWLPALFPGAEMGARLCNRWTVVSCQVSRKFEDKEKLAFEEQYPEGPAPSGSLHDIMSGHREMWVGPLLYSILGVAGGGVRWW